MVEQLTVNQLVAGSNPASPAKIIPIHRHHGSLGGLVNRQEC